MMKKNLTQPATYETAGVRYTILDPFKRLAQQQAQETSDNLHRMGMQEITASRGESAFVWEEPDGYRVCVIEGLGTKNCIADEVRKYTSKTHYDAIAQDTVAMIVNDVIVVGADPQVVTAYFAVGNSDWFADEERAHDLVEGWKKACSLAGAVWGGGETPTLKGIFASDTIDLAGSAIGIIRPKGRLTLGEKLTPGDVILLVESSGIHANGLTLARSIASKLPSGYKTLLSDGKSYGESLLIPTNIYVSLIRDIFDAGVDIHYMVNITGHGWKKLLRATQDFWYTITQVPPVQPIFQFIQKHAKISDEEMYGTFNMGAGFALFVPEKDVLLVQNIAREKYGWLTCQAGRVEAGPKQLTIEPKKIRFAGNSLGIR